VEPDEKKIDGANDPFPQANKNIAVKFADNFRDWHLDNAGSKAPLPRLQSSCFKSDH
jgi:hypothetical protein